MGCDAGAADGGFGLLRIAWGVGMAAGAVLAEPGSAGLSTGDPRARLWCRRPKAVAAWLTLCGDLTGRLGDTLEGR